MSRYAEYPFPFGTLRIGYEGDAVTLLKKIDGAEGLKKPKEAGERNALTDQVYREVMEYLRGERTAFTFSYELRGTDFQKKVWNELCRIPYGETRTYQEVAAAVGNPKACRAVGMANNKNPVILAVPCHRVIGADGRLVGYGGGLDMKEALLRLEKTTKDAE